MLSKDPDSPYLGTQLADQLVEHIRVNKLSDGDFLPSEQEIARTYGASMRVVRDALRMLSQQGVIRSQQGRRSEVTSLRPIAVRSYFRLMLDAREEALSDLLEFRTILETSAVALAAERIDTATLDELANVLGKLERLDEKEAATRSELDLKFHSEIARSSGNEFIDAVVDALYDALALERERGVAATDSAGESHEKSDTEHRAILAALVERDGAKAQQLMAAHLDRVRASRITRG